MRSVVGAFLLIAALNPLFSQYDIKGSERQVSLGYYFQVAEDSTKQLTIVDASSEYNGKKFNWKKIGVDQPNFGYSNSAYWIKVVIVGADKDIDNYRLEISYPLLDHIEFYTQTDSGFKSTVVGDIYPFGERMIESPYFVFPISLKAQVDNTFYFRIVTTSPVIIPLTLWSNDGWLEKERHEQIAIWLYYGLVAGIFLYNLLIYIMTREKLHLLYCLTVLSYASLSLGLNGYGTQYFWPNILYLKQESTILFLSLSTITHLLFMYAYLYGKITRRWQWLVTINLVGLICVVFVSRLLLPYRVIIGSLIGITLIIMIFILTVNVIEIRNKKKIAYFYLSGIVFFVLGNALVALRTFAFVPSHLLIHWAGQIGSAAELLLFSLGIGYRYNLIKLERDQAEIRNLQEKILMLESFSRFVPRQFIKILEKEDVSYLNLGDSREVQMSILFADIRNFTGLAETMNSADTFNFINSYLRRMGPVIQQQHGFIDKFIGDAIMALFPEPTNQAVNAAIAMRSALSEFNQKRLMKGYEPIEMGIGINAGTIMLGTVGSTGRLDTTVIGDSVNLASRIESLTKHYGVHILISDSIYQSLEEPERYHLRELDTVIVKGKSKPVVLFEVFNNDNDEIKAQKLAMQSTFALGLLFYRTAKFAEAIEQFTECVRICPTDKPSKLYLQLCKNLKKEILPIDWYGVTRLD